jgi:hypothetical protein
MRDDLVAQIRERPMLSVGIAFGTGVVLGQIFDGRDDEDEDEDRRPRRRRGSKHSLVKAQLSGPIYPSAHPRRREGLPLSKNQRTRSFPSATGPHRP